jgi:hypothetical protein
MQLITSRRIPYLETHSLAPGQAQEALFRNGGGFVLYLSDGKPAPAGEERVIRLGLREALIWLNEPSQDQGSFWT